MTSATQYSQDNQNYFNSHPHEEDDGNRKRPGSIHGHFNSHPHEEDDVNRVLVCYCLIYFNSHPHEEDDGRND